MAKTPQETRTSPQQVLNEDEKRRANDLEKLIDDKNVPEQIDTPGGYSDRVVEEVLMRFRRAGWNARRRTGDQHDQFDVLEFRPKNAVDLVESWYNK
jgi:hypothetical protein